MIRMLCVVLVLLGVAGHAAAGEVVLRNGDRLTGRVTRLHEGRLTIRTELAGEVTVSLDDVRTFRTNEPVEVHLRDGTVINRPLVADEQGRVAIEGDDLLEAQTIDLADIRAINPPGVRWTGDLSLGLMVARGNADAESVNVRFNAVRRGETDRITLGGAYYYGRQRDPDNGDRHTTQDTWNVHAKYDHFFTPRFYGYTNVRIERDRVAALDLRVAPGVGFGYQWIDRPDMRFSTEGGLTWFYENYMDATPARRTLSARLAYNLERRVFEASRLFHTLEYYPSLERLDDYLIKTQLGLRTPLTQRLFTELKVEADYDATPAIGAERLDVRYVMSAGYNF